MSGLPPVAGAGHWPSDHEPSAWKYVAGCRHGACREAARISRASARDRAVGRAAEDPRLVRHGTTSGYAYWACRCPGCAEASRMARAGYRAARKAGLGLPLTDFDREVLGEQVPA